MNILQTDRLTIRELSLDNLEDLSLVLSDPKIMRYSTVGVHTRPQLIDYIRKCLEQYKTQKHGRWGIFTTLKDEFIGLCGLSLEDDGLVHINYRLASKSHGNGFAIEAVNGLVGYARNTLKIKSIAALIEPENLNSIKVVEGSGFDYIGQSKFKGFDVSIYQIQIT